MTTWIHRLLNPHCVHCFEEKLEIKNCPSCTTLKEQLVKVNRDNEKLLGLLLEEKVEFVLEKNPIEPKQEIRGPVPWRVKREMLEASDRETARLLQQKKAEMSRTGADSAKSNKPIQQQIKDLENEVLDDNHTFG